MQEVDERLISKCGFGLYNFAFSLAIVLNDFPIFGFPEIWVLKNAKIPGIEEVRDEIQRLKDVRSKLVKLAIPLKKHIQKIPDFHKVRGGVLDERIRALFFDRRIDDSASVDELILTAYKLDQSLHFIDEEIAFFRDSKWVPFRKKSGKATEPRMIIQAFWSLVIRRGRIADMEYINALINWFADKLEATDYGHLLSYEPNRSSVRRFKQINREKLNQDLKLFFPRPKNTKSKSVIETRDIQIRFAKRVPEIYLFASSNLKNECPLIVFLFARCKKM
jgi:hypothetical protein